MKEAARACPTGRSLSPLRAVLFASIGHVQIEHDLGRRLRVRFQKHIHQKPVQGFARVGDLVIAIAAAAGGRQLHAACNPSSSRLRG